MMKVTSTVCYLASLHFVGLATQGHAKRGNEKYEAAAPDTTIPVIVGDSNPEPSKRQDHRDPHLPFSQSTTHFLSFFREISERLDISIPQTHWQPCTASG
jgi:hypothetical protein